ncbi:hypothetical protein CB1_000995050 [Camelus ferus]|nr:hypothetical protein CB1_000995050 [Camelus ferus]
MEMVKDALDQLRGAVMIVYPMGLPPYDPIRMEFENKEDLSGTQVCGPCAVCKAGLNVIKESEAQLWWAAKELRRTKKLSDYVGKNEKTKIIVKIQQRGQGAPAREPIISPEEQKQLMLHYHRRQEELKETEEGQLTAAAVPKVGLVAAAATGQVTRAKGRCGLCAARAEEVDTTPEAVALQVLVATKLVLHQVPGGQSPQGWATRAVCRSPRGEDSASGRGSPGDLAQEQAPPPPHEEGQEQIE